MKKYTITKEEELAVVADAIHEQIQDNAVVCFYGEMGSGKTTLIKVLCSRLGVADTMSSPSFSIVNEYRDKDDFPIYHFDFYRIENTREALDIGTEEYFYSGNLCLVEWPERINDLIPENHLKINIKLVGDNNREITVSNGG